MGGLPSPRPVKSISEIGSAVRPTKPTLNSRPATYSWTSTSSHMAVTLVSRSRSASGVRQTEPSSMPTLASSIDGLTMTGYRSPSGSTGSCTSAKRGTGDAGRLEQRVGHVLPVADGDGPGAAAGKGHPGQLQRGHHVVLEARVAVDALAEVEDQVGLLATIEPGEVAQVHRHRLGLVAGGPEDLLDFPDVAEDGGDVGRTPLVAAAVVQDDDLHAATSARSRCPVIRRQAMSATVWISSS